MDGIRNELVKGLTIWFSFQTLGSKVKAYIYILSSFTSCSILGSEWIGEDLWPILSITRFFIMQCNRHTYKCVQEYEIIFTHKRYLIITYDSIDEYFPTHIHTLVYTPKIPRQTQSSKRKLSAPCNMNIL